VGTANFTDKLALGGGWLLEHAAQISAVFASVYTLLLITDWWWKRFWKPLLLKLGWVKGKPRPFMSSTDHTPFDAKPRPPRYDNKE